MRGLYLVVSHVVVSLCYAMFTCNRSHCHAERGLGEFASPLPLPAAEGTRNIRRKRSCLIDASIFSLL